MEREPTTKKLPRWRGAFLGALSDTGNVTGACRNAKCDRKSVYALRKSDPEFSADWDKAIEASIDKLEAEARRRAHDGVVEPVFYKGVEVGGVRKYSDVLLIFLLKGARPHVYRERHEFSGNPNEPIRVEYVNDWNSDPDDSPPDAAPGREDRSPEPEDE